MIFGREAYTYAPLTLDHGTLLRMVAELRSGIVDGRGTAIGNGLGVALARLRKSDAKSKVIILLTDGDNNAGNISPTQVRDLRAEAGREDLHHPGRARATAPPRRTTVAPGRRATRSTPSCSRRSPP